MKTITQGTTKLRIYRFVVPDGAYPWGNKRLVEAPTRSEARSLLKGMLRKAGIIGKKDRLPIWCQVGEIVREIP